jgi:hypothetical protein
MEMPNRSSDISLRTAAIVAGVSILVMAVIEWIFIMPMVVGEVGLALCLLFKGGRRSLREVPLAPG